MAEIKVNFFVIPWFSLNLSFSYFVFARSLRSAQSLGRGKPSEDGRIRCWNFAGRKGERVKLEMFAIP